MQTVSRLIDTFKPSNYKLNIDIDREARKFGGTVTIAGESFTGEIRVHAKALTISNVRIDGKQAKWSEGIDDELTLTCDGLLPGEHTIDISYDGIISDQLNGLYPCYYDHDGIKKELMMTQFESHHARQVFPCVDEPAAKATFDLTLITETDVTVIGNMPHKSQKIDNRSLVTEFETTPVMSTYLLAFIVGDLQKITAQTKSGVEVNVYSTPAQPIKNLTFALDHAVKTIEFFDEYFDEPYPLPKSDHVAVPDFSSGAMENWGLITYREIALLTEPSGPNISSRQYIATVVSHELSHQWFGNLVTMKWWNNLWLNESFATLMEYVAVDSLQPNWNIWQSFATYESLLALRRDSIDGVQSVQIDVHHPDELNTVFDGAIVYAKGARLLYMLKSYIGDKAFRDGLRLYFNKHKYSNTAETDLWAALSETSGKDIGKFMTPWISQPGFPIISIKHSGDSVTLTQDQFFVGPHESSDRIWPIPLGSSDKSIPELMDTKEITIKTSDSFILNEVGSAHFITKYDEIGADNLLANIDRQTETVRMQLLNERLMLARAGLIDSAKLIDWLIAYRHETSQPVWDIIATAIGDLKKFVETDEAAENKLRRLVCEISQEMYEKLGWDHDANETSETTKLRSTIISLAIYGQCQPAIEKALEIYYSMPLEKIDSELRSMVIATVVREAADNATIDGLLSTHKTTNNAELRQDIVSGLTASKSSEVLSRLLGLIKDTTRVRTQDTVSWYVSLLRNKYSRTMTWQWLRNDWRWIEQTFAGDMNYDAFPRYTSAILQTRAQFEEFKTFFGPMVTNYALKRPIEIGIKDIEGRVEIIEKYSSSVADRLSNL